MKDGEHKIWQCEKFKETKIAEGHEAFKKCNLSLLRLGSGRRIGQCILIQNCRKDGCSKRYNIFLYSDEKKPNPANNADAVLPGNLCCGGLRIVPITLSNLNTSIETMAVCDTGYMLSVVDKILRDQLDDQGNALTQHNIAAINKTKEMACEKVRINVTTPNESESMMFHIHPSMYLGSKLHDTIKNNQKRKFSHLDVLPNNSLNLKK